MSKILVIGASGQIGTELVVELRSKYGNDNIVAADLKTPGYQVFEGGPFEFLDVLEVNKLKEIVDKHDIKVIYLLAALLSATAEQHPKYAWQLNMDGLFNVLDLAKEKIIDKVFWPSSIAVFGPNTPKDMTPQYTIKEPNTVYGVSKLAGERWCEYYSNKYGVDVRSIRYPGLISYKALPGGGTTDYAIHIFHEAIDKKFYKCFLRADTTLPMMYMQDAIRATIDITERERNDIIVRSSYNIAGMSFSPKELAEELRKHISDFEIKYEPDHRQAIADSWPKSIDDELAQKHWGWKSRFKTENMVADMLKNIVKNY